MLGNTQNSTPKAALEIMYDLSPTSYVIKKEAIQAYLRNKEVIRNEPSSVHIKSHFMYKENMENKWEFTKEPSDRTNFNCWDKLYTIKE